jgi:hypothetical protein
VKPDPALSRKRIQLHCDQQTSRALERYCQLAPEDYGCGCW